MRKDRRKPIVRYYEGLPQIRANAAGMDIGAEEIWVDVGNKDVEGVRRFGTFTADLNEMAEWLKQCGIETVAMESTGGYWIAPFQILEAKGIEVFLVNARFVKNVQGRKSDMLDCQWIRCCTAMACCRSPSAQRPRSPYCGVIYVTVRC